MCSPGVHDYPACSILLSIMTVCCTSLLIACIFVFWNCSKRLKHSSVTIKIAFWLTIAQISRMQVKLCLFFFFFKLHLCIVATYSLCSISPNTTYKKTYNLFTALFTEWNTSGVFHMCQFNFVMMSQIIVLASGKECSFCCRTIWVKNELVVKS